MSDMISSHQCNSTMTVMSSWSQYHRSYEAKCHYELTSPTMHNSNMTVVSGSESYPQSWCHMPTLFWEISEISQVLHLWWLWWIPAGCHQLSLSDMISSHQCNSTMTVISSWSWYVKSYEAKCATSFPALQMDISDMTVVLDSRTTLKVGVTCLPYFQK